MVSFSRSNRNKVYGAKKFPVFENTSTKNFKEFYVKNNRIKCGYYRDLKPNNFFFFTKVTLCNYR